MKMHTSDPLSSDAHNLWERLKVYEKAVLLFARSRQVPFTNNRAERVYRWLKSNKKCLEISER